MFWLSYFVCWFIWKLRTITIWRGSGGTSDLFENFIYYIWWAISKCQLMVQPFFAYHIASCYKNMKSYSYSWWYFLIDNTFILQSYAIIFKLLPTNLLFSLPLQIVVSVFLWIFFQLTHLCWNVSYRSEDIDVVSCN